MNGKISIGKVTCCGDSQNDYIRIQIEDTESSIGFVTVKMELKDFTQALFGLGNVPVEFELRGMDRVGKKYEHKTIEVMITHPSSQICPREGDIDIAVSKYEVDGWLGSRKNCSNFHKHIRSGDNFAVYNVHYCRWVDIENKE